MFGLLVGPIAKLLSTGIGGFFDHLNAKKKLKQTKVDSERRVVEARANHIINLAEGQQNHEINWDIIQAEGAKTSWKDEYLTIILSIPAIMSFVPGCQMLVAEGFDALARAPEWYLLAFGTMVAASFGMRNIVPHFKKK